MTGGTHAHIRKLNIYPCHCAGSPWGHTHLASTVLSAPTHSAGHLFFEQHPEPWPQLSPAWFSPVRQQQQRSQQLLKRNTACLVVDVLTVTEHLKQKKSLKGQNYNTMALRGIAFELLPATRCGERGAGFKSSQKLVQTCCET